MTSMDADAQTELARLELPSRGNVGLRVVFVRVGDRVAHRCELLRQGELPQTILESVEGTAAELWPASPPLQQLHVEERAGGQRVALLVGMAGRGHWSLVVEPTSDHRGFVFDAACRFSAPAELLGSTYRWLMPSAECAVTVTMELPPVLASRSTAQLLDDAALRLQWQPATARLPATERWKYCVRLGDEVSAS